MTTEIAVVNKAAMALAADSTTTLGIGKTYQSHKLFALTNRQPVAAMVYNNAEFMGVPWETLIKMFREDRKDVGLKKVEDYLSEFREFIERETFATESQQAQNFAHLTNAALYRLKLAVGPSPSPEQFTAVAQMFIDELSQHGAWEQGSDPAVKEFLSSSGDTVSNCIRDNFGTLDPKDELYDLLLELILQTVLSAEFTDNHSGVVIAGFGEDEMFPTLVEFRTDGVIGGVHKCQLRRTDISRDGIPSAIIPFGQEDAITGFMEGMTPDLVSVLVWGMGQFMTRMSMEFLAEIGVEDENVVQSLSHSMAEKSQEFLRENLDEQRRQNSDSIMNIVQHLPKEELAEIAETLVNLTALRRRVSMGIETVGGPVDVALISKGDGLIWIKRKHYFDPMLNPNYFLQRIPAGGTHVL